MAKIYWQHQNQKLFCSISPEKISNQGKKINLTNFKIKIAKIYDKYTHKRFCDIEFPANNLKIKKSKNQFGSNLNHFEEISYCINQIIQNLPTEY